MIANMIAKLIKLLGPKRDDPKRIGARATSALRAAWLRVFGPKRDDPK